MIPGKMTYRKTIFGKPNFPQVVGLPINSEVNVNNN